MSERLPPPDSARVAATKPRRTELVRLEPGTVVVRVYHLGGPNRSAWNELRAFGPTRSRFDHHTLPRRIHPTRAIAYLATGPAAFTTAMAEYFQDDAGGFSVGDGHMIDFSVYADFGSSVTGC